MVVSSQSSDKLVIDAPPRYNTRRAAMMTPLAIGSNGLKRSSSKKITDSDEEGEIVSSKRRVIKKGQSTTRKNLEIVQDKPSSATLKTKTVKKPTKSKEYTRQRLLPEPSKLVEPTTRVTRSKSAKKADVLDAGNQKETNAGLTDKPFFCISFKEINDL